MLRDCCWGQGTRLLPLTSAPVSFIHSKKQEQGAAPAVNLHYTPLIVCRVINIWNQMLCPCCIKTFSDSCAPLTGLQEQHRAPVVPGSIVSWSWDVNLSLKEKTSWPTGNRAALNSSRAHVKFSWHHYPFPEETSEWPWLIMKIRKNNLWKQTRRTQWPIYFQPFALCILRERNKISSSFLFSTEHSFRLFLCSAPWNNKTK